MATIPTLKENLVIENIRPSIEGGRFMLKREPGDTVTLQADIFRHSHEKYDAAIFYRHVSKKKWEHIQHFHTTPISMNNCYLLLIMLVLHLL